MASYVSALAARAYAQHQTSPIAALAAHRVAPRSVEHLEQELAERPDLQDQLAVLTGYSPSVWVIEHELDEIGQRRADLHLGTVDTDHSDPLLRAFHSNLIGLACSGGGIRSASFNLGVLQELARLDLLRHVDYLCSVSGGGYIHQWLAAWLRRFSPGYPGATAATPLAAFTEVAARLQPAETTVRGVEAPQLQWLRRYSNYLTPRQG